MSMPFRKHNPSRQEVIVMLLDGVARIARATKSLTEEQWGEAICGHWTAQELALHLLAESRNHHNWLDNAISGDASIPYSESEVDERNEAAIKTLSGLAGPQAIQEFVRTAGRYANRVADHWDEPLGFAGGSATAGQHCALIALEYHLHAWDLIGDTHPGYQPPRVRQLAAAVAATDAAQHHGLGRLKTRAATRLSPRVRTWKYLLRQSGRAGARSKDDAMLEPSPVIDLRGDSQLTLSPADRSSVSSD